LRVGGVFWLDAVGVIWSLAGEQPKPVQLTDAKLQW
jgi:hypothetical protein